MTQDLLIDPTIPTAEICQRSNLGDCHPFCYWDRAQDNCKWTDQRLAIASFFLLLCLCPSTPISRKEEKMLIVGERINASRKAIAAAISAQDAAAIKKEAIDQKNAGAHFIDVNAGVFVDEEVRYLKWMVQTIQQEGEIPLCIDSPNPKAIAEALALHKGRAMINPITDEKERYQDLIPIIRQFKPLVVALCMTDGGMPHTSDESVKLASRLIEKLTHEGVAPQDIYIDPLVMPISTDKNF